jgi:hypothetical protein
VKLLAVVLALLLISGALAIRNAIHEDGEPKVSTDDGAATVTDDDRIVLGCISELMAICVEMREQVEGLDEVVEVNPGAVADVVRAAQLDAWMTFDPWPVAEAFTDDALFEKETIPVAEDTIGLLISEPYADRLGDRCPDESLVSCAAAETTLDGTAALGVGDPGSALGGILLTATLTEIVGTPELSDDDVAAQRSLLDTVLATMPDKDQLGVRLGLATDRKMAVVSRNGEGGVAAKTPEGTERNLKFVPSKVGKQPIKLRVVMAVVPGADRGDLENVVDIETKTPSIFEDAKWRNVPSDEDTGLPAGDILLALVQQHRR